MKSATAWLITLPFVIWAVARTFDPLDGYRITELLAFTPYVALGSAAALALSLALRRWVAAAVAGICAIALLASVLPRAFGGQSAEIEDGVPLTVMTLNMSDGEAAAEEIVDLVDRRDVDLLSVQEMSSEELRRSGLRRILPLRVLAGDRNGIYATAGGQGLLDEPVGPGAATAAGVRLSSPGTEVEVWAPHPPSPTDPKKFAQWQATFESIPPATGNGPLRVIASDLNATLDHPELREVIGSGYVDAADAVGSGLITTFPSSGFLPPPITIDHVLVDSRIEVVEVWVEEVSGTDHRAVIAELLVPRQ